MGYILWELFTLLLVIAMAKGILRFRRGLGRRQVFTDNDRRMLKEPIRVTGSAPVRYLRYALVFALIVTVGAIEIAIVSQFGATILTGALLLTSVAIVRWTLVES
jgi:hypothetical protein